MIFDFLSQATVLAQVDAQTKDQIVDTMLQCLDLHHEIHDINLASQDLKNNEARMAMGMQHGIAIPHAKTAAVTQMMACVAVSKAPIDCSSIDGHPSRIFIMILSPPDQTGPHVRFLSEIGRILKSKKLRKQMLTAKNSDQLFTALKSQAKE